MEFITSQHRYYTLNYYLKKRFKKKVFKVALNGNFTCPNRDGSISTKGCIFCSEKGSGDFAGNVEDSLQDQFNMVKNIIHQKWKDALYIAYFQANTNTYAPLSRLKKLYEEAISLDENIVALSIATRPDSISDEVIEYLGELNKKIPVWIELGLQTIHQKTDNFINRGYTLDVFHKAVNNLRKHNIEVIVHVINGLPYETKEMMLDTIKYLNTLDIQGIKIHSLYILENTILGQIYQSNPFKVLSLDEYVDIVTEQLAILRPDIVIHRISGDAPKDQLLAPLWGMKKFVVMNEINKEMKRRDYFQGCKYKS
ncbi:MAG TPA: TIGR01212 family radical SAM protein [Acholeplasmataceae bacterium]|nr:TIGR01212 family radical SAM protein [Acholeplasmataceae bacterium]